MADQSPVEPDELSDYDIYSKTPPRTKILRKNRERKQRDKSVTVSPSPKGIKIKNLSRRNTISTMYDELLAKADQPSDSELGTNKRVSKRSMKLLRGSERDLKLDIPITRAFIKEKNNGTGEQHIPSQPSFQIESCKRFMSLSCRTVACSRQKDGKTGGLALVSDVTNENSECPQSRVDFYHTFSMLIRMGCGDKQERNPRRVLSREETLWQNELKDVIWLELQAFHADRTPTEEDTYLCTARESVEPLLREIMNYRFHKLSRRYSAQNSDSGVEDDCPNCLSLFCVSCMEAQNEALREVEAIMKRLEDAESLFPSSKAFAELYPLYSSPEFVGRVKAISLWYNMTKHQRLKLAILGKLLTLVDAKQCQWPLLGDDTTSDSPSDSNNSSGSSVHDYFNGKNSDLYNITPVAMLINKKDENNVSPYRRYIENILKTRALHKSLNFLEHLHEYVLRKAQLTLEKPQNKDIFSKISCDSDEEELIRYGSWSPEAKSLDLPSYRSTFIFLAAVPLEVIHEYLLMRLEQKPENPSPLSVRQLMRELKEGLRIASVERQRIIDYVKTATTGMNEHNTDHYVENLASFDNCMLNVFKDYLDYLEQWALLHHETFQKNLLEEEYQFSCKLFPNIPGGADLMASKFAYILSCILKRIGERLMQRIEDVLDALPKKDDIMVKSILFSVCRELQSLFNEEREMSLKTMAFCRTLFKFEALPWKCKKVLRDSIISFKCLIPQAIGRIQNLFDLINFGSLDELDKASLNSRIREILMQVYRFGFEFYKEMSESISTDKRIRLVGGMVQFANLWMQFVTDRCERGRGMRPRWAYQGLEFLLTVCEPCNTKYLTEEEFEDLQKNMDVCISHVIGTTAPSTPDSGIYSASPRSSLEHIRTKSRGSSPSPRPTYKSQRSNASAGSRKTSMEQNSPVPDAVDNINFNNRKEDKNGGQCVRIKLPPTTHAEHVREAIDSLETEINDRLRKQLLIGTVLNCNTENKTHIRRRNVTFSWQRGIKIGQGRFGKVYTAVNNNTGEMMAVKEIALQHNDNLTIKRVSEEIKILEGIVHQNLVRYYGVEVHKEEMLIFMEFCAEGTLENLVAATEGGLPELLVRRYTFQLVSGVAVLHDHGIVHRDIKTANIFLTDEGNCLKIGDFGCAAKIMASTTMPGELKGWVGTQAYMAPEVFTRTMSEGHGRAADIWSVGCVVVEMSSGQRPWAQFDSNYQIMFKVGMGQSPDPPDDMIDEGLDFLDICFKHNPKERATAHELLAHSFVKAANDFM